MSLIVRLCLSHRFNSLFDDKRRLTFSVIFFCFPFCLLAQIINVEDRRAAIGDSIGWYETLEIGSNLVKNNSSLFSIYGEAQIEFAYKKRKLLSLTKASFVKAGDENFVNQGFQHIRYNSQWTKWLVYELFGQGQYNEQAMIRLRALVGTGFRFRILQKKDDRVHLGLSYMYEYDQESNEEIVHHDHRLNSYFSFGIRVAKVVNLTSTTYFQPLFDNFSDHRISSETSGEFQITKKLFFETSYIYAFDARAPEGAPSTIYSLTNGLKYKF